MLDIIVGLQWGDEGKGKIVDFLTQKNKYEFICRYQGGPNAGHTLVFDDKSYVLHTIPSGIFQENTKNIIASGVVIDPVTFIYNEIKTIAKERSDYHDNIIFSNKAHVIIPSHKLLDKFHEENRGENKIGSTNRGIGPTYSDKYTRIGLRVGELCQNNLKERFEEIKNFHKGIMKEYFEEYYSLEEEKKWFEAVEELKKFHIRNTELILNEALKENKNVLAEGAQGCLLDIDYGSYPFVTSSNTLSAYALISLGVSHKYVNDVWGIFKAYSTRVGEGPFPSELFDETGERLGKIGKEFGSTTKRKRRCGWLDLVLLKYAIMLNGVNKLAMMKADVLDEFDDISVITEYISQKSEEDLINLDPKNMKKETLTGWKSKIDTKTPLPKKFKEYINFIEKNIEKKLSIISTGPDRKETLFL